MRPRTRSRWPLLLAAALIAVANCRDVDITAVEAASIEISPAEPTVQVDRTTPLTARVLSSEGRVLSNRSIEWRSLDPEIASVDQSGTVLGIEPGAATIRATSGGASATVDVTVTAAPQIQLSVAEVELTAVAGASSPADRTVAVTNSGAGSLSQLSADVEYADGGASGWLTAALAASSAPTSLVLSADQEGLAEGVHTAVVRVSSPDAANSPLALEVSLTVLPPGPSIGVEPGQLEFTTVAGTDPAAASIAITNTGGGTLNGLAASVSYPAGQPSGWVQLTLSATNAPATLTVRAVVAGLPAGRYTSAVHVTSPVAASPATIQVTLDVEEAAPAIGTTSASISFATTTAAGDPEPQSITVTNTGGGTLGALAAEVLYTSGQPVGWLSAALVGTTAPTSLELTARRGTLAVGSYTARVRLTSAQASNSPVDVTVTFTVSDVAPATPSGLAATARSERRIDLAWTDESDNEAGFVIERSVSGGAWTEIVTTAAGATAFVDSAGLDPSTAYLYRIRACNAVGCSSTSATVTAMTAPAPPTELSAAAAGATLVELTWRDNSSDETGFRVERSTDGTTWSTVSTTPADAEQYDDAGVSPETSYEYRIRACRLAVCSSPSPTASVTTGVPTPSAPAGLEASAASMSRIVLDWDASTGAVAEYRIERRQGTGEFAQVATVNGSTTTLEDTGLAAGTTYGYRVRACNASGCSTYSNTASATTLPPPPSAPAGLSATAVSSSRIDLGWSAASGSVGEYRIERRTGGGSFSEIARIPTGTLTYRDEGLAPSTTYEYRVRACNASGCSAFSATASATTTPAVPDAPSNLDASPVSASQIHLEWAAATGAVDDYRIERRTSTTSFAQIATVSAGTTFENTGLSANTLYVYRVRASNAGGFSGYTAPDSAWTNPNPPTGLTATVVSESRIDLAWSAPAGGASEYLVERREGTGAYTQIGALSATALEDTGLEPGTSYTYRVRACNPSGCSEYSSTATEATLPAVPGAPSGLAADALSESEIRLTWAAASGTVDEYSIERRQGEGGEWTEITTVLAGMLQYDDTDVISEVEYFYRVRACNVTGCSEFSPTASATTLPAAPAAPSNLETSPVSASQIHLEWAAATGAVDDYRIERRTSTTSFAQIATVSGGTTFENTDLSANTQYFYRVRASNTGGFSDYTAPDSAWTNPNPPTDVTATAVSESRIDLSWSAPAGGASEYRVERREGSGTFTQIATVDDPTSTFEDSGLVAGTSYTYQVRACNPSGCSEYSSTATEATLPAVPGAPSGLAADALSESEIRLTWTAAAGTVDEYSIERRQGGGGEWAEIATVPAGTLQYDDDSVISEVEYSYRVRACNVSGCSPYSNEASAATDD